MKREDYLQLKAWEIRRLVLDMDYRSGAGHIGGAMSAAEILSVLFFDVLRLTPAQAEGKDPARDHFVLSKGHISDGYYAALALAGFFPTRELATYSAYESRLSGHPTTHVPGVEFNTGALGHGLSDGVGLALGNRLDGLDSKVYVLLGDGELAEGSVWEAAMAAAHYGLDSLTAIVDRNGLQIGGTTEDLMALEPLADKWASFGWEVVEADGHDVTALLQALTAPRCGKPRVILARTIKGKGVSYMEGNVKWHHGTPNREEYLQGVTELNGKLQAAEALTSCCSEYILPPLPEKPEKAKGPSYVPARQAVLEDLTQRAKTNPRIVTLTSDARGSASMSSFIREYPDRFFEMGIAEQNEVSVASGLAVQGKIPVVCAPACFLAARAYEQVKTDLAYPMANVRLLGVSGGVAYGELGQTHHSLQDAAVFCALPGMHVVLPADAPSARALMGQSLEEQGPYYFRVGRAATAPVYSDEEAASLRLGKAHIAREGKDGCILTSGIFLLHAMEAAEALSKDGIELTVADFHTLKPFDAETVRTLAARFGKLLTLEEHVAHGGLGSLVLAALAEKPVPVKVLAFPDENVVSGSANALYRRAGLDAENVERTVREWL